MSLTPNLYSIGVVAWLAASFVWLLIFPWVGWFWFAFISFQFVAARSIWHALQFAPPFLRQRTILILVCCSALAASANPESSSTSFGIVVVPISILVFAGVLANRIWKVAQTFGDARSYALGKKFALFSMIFALDLALLTSFCSLSFEPFKTINGRIATFVAGIPMFGTGAGRAYLNFVHVGVLYRAVLIVSCIAIPAAFRAAEHIREPQVTSEQGLGAFSASAAEFWREAVRSIGPTLRLWFESNRELFPDVCLFAISLLLAFLLGSLPSSILAMFGGLSLQVLLRLSAICAMCILLFPVIVFFAVTEKNRFFLSLFNNLIAACAWVAVRVLALVMVMSLFASFCIISYGLFGAIDSSRLLNFGDPASNISGIGTAILLFLLPAARLVRNSADRRLYLIGLPLFISIVFFLFHFAAQGALARSRRQAIQPTLKVTARIVNPGKESVNLLELRIAGVRVTFTPGETQNRRPCTENEVSPRTPSEFSYQPNKAVHIMLNAELDSDGSLRKIQAFSGDGEGFRQEAVTNLSLWRFKPPDSACAITIQVDQQ